MANELRTEPQRDADWWYIRLSFAARNGDRQEAAEAVRQLAGLGVEVRLEEYMAQRTNGGAA